MLNTPGQNPHESTNNRKVVAGCLAALGVMTGVTAYSPTLYKLFCQVTGYGGTTQRAAAAPGKILDKVVTVRFDANVSPKLAWKFEPVQKTMDVKVGENALAFFRATNTSNETLIGTAAFNVSPDVAGAYFNKIECFCFTEQTLKPGQTAEMPVSFFIDPKFVEDRDTSVLSNLTLSYVFYPVQRTADAARKAGGE